MSARLGCATALIVALALSGCGGPSQADIKAKERREQAAAQAKEKEAAHAEAARKAEHARALVAPCAAESQRVRTALQDLNSRLAVGLSYADYSSKVGDVSSAFDAGLNQFTAEQKAKKVTANCLRVFTSVATAVDLHAAALKTWGDCIDDYNCDIDKGPEADKMQKNWLRAGTMTDQAQRRLTTLKPLPDE